MYHLRLFCLEYIGSTSLEIHFLCGMQKRKGKGGGEGDYLAQVKLCIRLYVKLTFRLK